MKLDRVRSSMFALCGVASCVFVGVLVAGCGARARGEASRAPEATSTVNLTSADVATPGSPTPRVGKSQREVREGTSSSDEKSPRARQRPGGGFSGWK